MFADKLYIIPDWRFVNSTFNFKIELSQFIT